jgi:hypothetical protein
MLIAQVFGQRGSFDPNIRIGEHSIGEHRSASIQAASA